MNDESTYKLEMSTQALWYAWGYFDSHERRQGLSAGDFADLYGSHVEDFESGRVCHRLSIHRAFQQYLEGKRVFL